MAITVGELSVLLSARDEATKVIKGVKDELGNASKTMTSLGKDMMGVGSKLSLGVTAPLVILGKQAVQTAADFESQMNVMSLAARSSGTSLDTLREAAIAVGGDTRLVGINAAQTAEAMTNFYKAGLNTADIMGDLNSYMEDGTELGGALRAAIDLAAASELDLGAASDIVAIAMATFGLEADEASRITNSFVQTADASVASVGELADALTNVGPTAAAFGWSMEDVNVALGILSQRGIKGAEAGTALKSMMTNIMRTTPDVTAALKQLNVELYNTDGTMKSLPEIIGQFSSALELGAQKTIIANGLTEKQSKELEKLRDKYSEAANKQDLYAQGLLGTTMSAKEKNTAMLKLTEQMNLYAAEMGPLMELERQQIPITTTMTEEMRNNYVQTLAGTYGMKAMNTLLAEGVPGWEGMTEAIGAAATAQESAAARTQGFNAAMETLQGVIETLMIKAAGPILNEFITPFVRKTTEMVDKVLELNPEMLRMGVMVAAAAAAAGPLLMVLGGVVTALGVLISPIGLVVAGVVALTAAFVKSQGGIGGAIGALKNGFETLAAVMQDLFAGDLGLAIDDFFEGFGIQLPQLKALIGSVLPVIDNLRALWEYVWPWMQAIVTKVLNDVVPFIKNMMYDASQFVQKEIGVLLAWWDKNFPLIWSTVSKILGFISKLWDTVWPALSTVLKAVWEIMKTTVETFIGNILSIIRAVMLIINGDWSGAWEEVKKILERTWNALKEIVGTALRALLDIVGPAVASLAKKFTDIDWGALGRGIIDGIRGGIENAAGALGDAAANAARRALDAAKRFLGIGSPSKVAAEEIGRPFVEGIQTGMDAAAPALMDTVADIMDSMVGVAESLTALGGYQSATGIGGVVDALIADTREAGKRLVAFFKLWKDSTFENVAMGGEASGLLGAMFAPIRQWVDGIVEIAGYQKAADIGRATTELIADTRIAGKQLVAFFKLWKDTTFENVEMGGAAAKALADLFAPARQIVDGVMAIASYQKQYNIGQAIADLIADARIAGKQLVTYFKLWHDGTFENVAMATAAGTAMAGLFKPVSTIIDGVVAIAEYQKAKRLTKAVQGMIADARTAGKALVDYFKLWHDGTFGNVAMATGAAQAMAGLFGAIQGMAESLMDIVGLPAIQPEQLDAAILLLTGFANGFMGACAYLLQAVDEVARLIMPGITAAMSSFAVSAAAAYDYLVIGMDTLGRMASKALAGEAQVNTMVASLQRTLNQLRLAASIQAQINGVSAKTTIGGGNIALPTNGGGNSSTTNNSYNLTVQTVQPAVNVVGSFRMLEAIG